MATTTLLSITGMWAATRKLPADPRVRTMLNATFGMAALQVASQFSFLLMKMLKFECIPSRRRLFDVLDSHGFFEKNVYVNFVFQPIRSIFICSKDISHWAIFLSYT